MTTAPEHVAEVRISEVIEQTAEAIAQRRPRVAVVGSINLDFIAGVTQMPARGETVSGDTLRVLPGGKGANQATQAALLGAQVSMVGRVGSTVLAQMAQAGMQAAEVDLTYVSHDPSLETGLAFVFVESTGDNRIVVAPRANGALTADHVRSASEAITAADVLLLQLEVPDEAIAAAVEIAHNASTKIVLNPAPARPLSAEVLSRTDYLVPNETEAVSLSQVKAAGEQALMTAAATKLIENGPDNVVITLGEQGAMAISRDQLDVRDQLDDRSQLQPIYVPAAPVAEVVDPTGAGDAFCAALGVGVAAGLDLEHCLTLGTIAGAHAVTSMGAQASMGSLADLEKVS